MFGLQRYTLPDTYINRKKKHKIEPPQSLYSMRKSCASPW